MASTQHQNDLELGLEYSREEDKLRRIGGREQEKEQFKKEFNKMLERDVQHLSAIQASIQRNTELTNHMVLLNLLRNFLPLKQFGILDGFDQRLGLLEMEIKPLHKKTTNLKILHRSNFRFQSNDQRYRV